MSLERAATVAAAVLGVPAAAVSATALLALALSGCGGPAPTPTAIAGPTSTPPATSTPTATVTLPTAPRATPTATPTPPPLATRAPEQPVSEIESLLRDVEARVAQIRGLPMPDSTDRAFVDRAELVAILKEELAEPETVEELEAAETLYRLLGLIPQDADLKALYEELLAAQVMGIYDSERQEMYVLSSRDGTGVPGALEEITYAHEYVHRLQDAAYDLEALTDEVEQDDELEAALTALVEGDATLTQTLYMAEHVDARRIMREMGVVATAESLTADLPYILRRMLEFPYFEGATFVAALWTPGGFADVDAAFADLPVSTEQVLHPEKYLAREPRLDPHLPDVSKALGAGWISTYENTLGELFLRTWLEALGDGESASAAHAAAGWGGDAYVLLEHISGEAAMAACIEWDTPLRDAVEFVAALADALDASAAFTSVAMGSNSSAYWDGPGGVLGILAPYGRRVWLAAGPDAAAVTELLEALAAE